MSTRSDTFRSLLGQSVIVADGGMGTMLQDQDPTLEDFQGYEGCNEILNVTRPDIVRAVHDAYLQVGCDAVETNTFGANLANLGEYEIPERTFELARAGAVIAREAADVWSTPASPRFVLGSIGPGTKLPSLGHAPYATLRDAYQECSAGLIDGGADVLLIETCQDLLQAKAAVVGAKRALADAGEDLPIIAQVTMETTGTMLMGSEIGAALVALAPLGIDAIGLNCATGPDEMSEHLRHLATYSSLPISVLPNAGLPLLGKGGAYYPLGPDELAAAHARFVREYGASMVGGCCGTTPAHLAAVVKAVGGVDVPARAVSREPSVSSLYSAVPLHQDTSYLSIGERTNANGSKAFREALLAARWDDCVEIAREQTRDGAHLLDVCIDYVGRDGVADMSQVAYRFSTASTLPLVLDSTEPSVVEAGLERLGGRAVINSVNYEDGDGESSRFTRMMRLAREHGAAVVALTIDEQGQARTTEHKVAVASRLIEALTGEWGMVVEDIIVDCLTFPIATGQEETRRDAIETIEAIRQITTKYPGVSTTLGVSNVSFGLKPAARLALNSVFLDECVKAGLSCAIVNSAKIVPTARIPAEQLDVALDLVYDRRRYDGAGNLVYDPLARLLELFEGVDSASVKASRAAALAELPVAERLAQRIIDGERNGLDEDLAQALDAGQDPLAIINDHLLAGMKTVGELFGSGRMQLPFVLQSAETMKKAVAYLEPAIEEAAAASGQARAAKAKILLATVKGDVHDIGKNLVDIILSNNGYEVVNLGIKQPITDIIAAAQEHEVDAIGMSGLLVKSTVVMKDNLQELNARGLAARWPILLGGAALTRSYVEVDLAEVYEGQVRYARDAFEGLRLMDAVAAARTDPSLSVAETLPALRPRRVSTRSSAGADEAPSLDDTTRSDVARDVPVPTPPFWGSRVIKGIALAEYAAYLDERATFLGQWGLKPGRGAREAAAASPDAAGGALGTGTASHDARNPYASASYDELVEAEGRPRLRMWLERIGSESIMEPKVVYGYFPCYSDGNDIVVVDPAQMGDAAGGPPPARPVAELREVGRFTFPRQRRGHRLCLADFFRDRAAAEARGPDVLALQLVTMGSHVSEVTGRLYAENAYRDYLELHGLSVQLTEALAEMWHARIRSELGLEAVGSLPLTDMLDVKYRGCRYSFGYPACPDLEQRATTVALLDPSRIGVILSEGLQLHPEQSTDALVVHHAQARYFNV